MDKLILVVQQERETFPSGERETRYRVVFTEEVPHLSALKLETLAGSLLSLYQALNLKSLTINNRPHPETLIVGEYPRLGAISKTPLSSNDYDLFSTTLFDKIRELGKE